MKPCCTNENHYVQRKYNVSGVSGGLPAKLVTKKSGDIDFRRMMYIMYHHG